MELTVKPTDDDLNINENLLPPDPAPAPTPTPASTPILIPKNQISNQQVTDVNQYFIDETHKKLENGKFIIKFPSHSLIICISSVIIIFGTYLLAFSIQNIELYQRIYIIFGGTILLLFIFFELIKKIEISNNNNKVYIKVINFLCCSKMKIILDRENTHFDIQYIRAEISNDTDTGTQTLFIINDYKNLVDIDLDKSNIKQKPAKLYYCFTHFSTEKYNYTEYTSLLNNFIGSSNNHNNPFFGNYTKLSNHFITYHFYQSKDICTNLGRKIIIIVFIMGLFSLIAFIIIGKYDNFIEKTLFIPVIIIFIYAVIKTIILCDKIPCRIDCIYSKNFDRFFIGLVKNTKTSYIKTFEYQTNNIDKFILTKKDNMKFELKVIFKNGDTQQMYEIKKKDEDELKELVNLLNGAIIKKSNNINNYHYSLK